MNNPTPPPASPSKPLQTGPNVSGEDAQRALSHLAAIVESSDDAIISKGLDGIITSWNHGAEHIFGYTAEEAIGKPITTIIPSSLRDEEVEIISRLKRGERIEHFETTRQAKDGALLPVSITISPVRDANDQIIGASKIAREISRQKKIEADLRELSESLEEQVVERTAVAEQRAGELRELALKLMQAEDQERQKLARALHDGLQQLLVAARFHASVILNRGEAIPEVRPAALQLDELLQQCIEASRSLAYELNPPALYETGLASAFHWLAQQMKEKYNLEVEVVAEEETPTTPKASRDVRAFLFQSVRELLLNVVKHARVDRAQISLGWQLNQLRLEISDRGAGFVASVDPQRAGGFGLFSIRERLAMLGGALEVQTERGQGTSMILTVPLPRESTNTGAEAPADSTASVSETAQPRVLLQQNLDANAKRILLVDDHRVIRQGLASLLNEESDLTVVGEASNGKEAIEMVRRVKPDVVLMDVSMPLMDGLEATRRIHDEFPDVVVIGLSMHEESSVVKKMCELGASAFFNKSGPSEYLFDAIRECKAVGV